MKAPHWLIVACTGLVSICQVAGPMVPAPWGAVVSGVGVLAAAVAAAVGVTSGSAVTK